MKTPMQLLIDKISRMPESNIKGFLKISGGAYLEGEKEHLIHTYWEAYKEGRYSGNLTAEEYYNQRYNPQDNGYSDFNL